MSTVVVRGSGGAVFTADVPASGFARKQWVEQIAKGDIVIVSEVEPTPEPAAEVDEAPAKTTPEPAAEVDEAPAKPAPARRGRPPKTDPKG